MDAGVGGTPGEASLPALFAVASPDAAPGGLYGPGGFLHLQGPPRSQRLYRRLTDPGAAARVWALSEQLTGATWGHTATPLDVPPSPHRGEGGSGPAQ